MAGRSRKRVGFLVNPVAGMGGRVALKGTDGEALGAAIARGAVPRAPARAAEFAAEARALGEAIEWITCGGPMGENALSAAGIPRKVVVRPREAVTHAEDTTAACRAFLAEGVDVVFFVGGDGTAKDVISAVERKVPIVGVPSGVKMHSGVFATTPRAAAEVLGDFMRGSAKEADGEVVDEDEEAYRQGRIGVSLKGVAKTLESEGLVQASKGEYGGEVEEVSKRGIADHILERMDPEALYIIGPGTTTGAVMEGLGLRHTTLGVDLLKGRKVLKEDATEADIKEAIAAHGGLVEIIVSVIGRQGFLFGRGNLQITPEVIRAAGKDHITVVAAEGKVEALKQLFVDTGDAVLDGELSGHWRVLCGYHWNVLLPIRGSARSE